MLNARYLENTISTHPVLVTLWGAKGESEVKRVVPYLQPAAIIRGGEGGVCASRATAVVFAMPDGSLIRFRVKGDNTYDYSKATVFPEDHPALANANSQTVDIDVSQDIPNGEPASQRDVLWLKETLDAQHKRALKEAKEQGLIP